MTDCRTDTCSMCQFSSDNEPSWRRYFMINKHLTVGRLADRLSQLKGQLGLVVISICRSFLALKVTDDGWLSRSHVIMPIKLKTLPVDSNRHALDRKIKVI